MTDTQKLPTEIPITSTPRPLVHPVAQIALAVTVSITVIIAVIALGLQNWQLGQQVQQLAANNDALREQVLSQGEEPVAPPAEQITGEPGAPGATGAQGPAGLNGTSVASVTCTSSGSWLISYDSGRTQTASGPCVGQDGQTVVGPAGADGADGKDGAPGATGAAGAPPFSWRWTSTSGIERECVRTDPFDAASPTYTCNVVTPVSRSQRHSAVRSPAGESQAAHAPRALRISERRGARFVVPR
ncbi:MAG: hypothetical protein AB7T06_24795 [Kofleriaceae bacterium]